MVERATTQCVHPFAIPSALTMLFHSRLLRGAALAACVTVLSLLALPSQAPVQTPVDLSRLLIALAFVGVGLVGVGLIGSSRAGARPAGS